MNDWLIMSVTREALSTWFSVGSSREEAEKYYSEGLANGRFDKPVYRVIAHRKSGREA